MTPAASGLHDIPASDGCFLGEDLVVDYRKEVCLVFG